MVFMYPCNKMLCWCLIAAGGAFLVSALIGSFWVSFSLGIFLLGVGLFFRRP